MRRCIVEDCQEPHNAKSYCNGHYYHYRRGRFGEWVGAFKVGNRISDLSRMSKRNYVVQANGEIVGRIRVGGKEDPLRVVETYVNEKTDLIAIPHERKEPDSAFPICCGKDTDHSPNRTLRCTASRCERTSLRLCRGQGGEFPITWFYSRQSIMTSILSS